MRRILILGIEGVQHHDRMVVRVTNNSRGVHFTAANTNGRLQGLAQGNERHRINARLWRVDRAIGALALLHVFLDAILDNARPRGAIAVLPAQRIFVAILVTIVLRVQNQLIESLVIAPDKGEVIVPVMIRGEPIGSALDLDGRIGTGRPF